MSTWKAKIMENSFNYERSTYFFLCLLLSVCLLAINQIPLPNFLLKITVHAVLDPDALSICTVFWKNQVGKMKFHEVSTWIFTACVAYKNQF